MATTWSSSSRLITLTPWVLRPWVLMPWKSKLAPFMISHKLFRLLIPFALIVLFASSLFGPPALKVFCFLQVVFYVLALAGLVLSRRKKNVPRFCSVPLTFCLLNAASLLAFIEYVLRRRIPSWK